MCVCLGNGRGWGAREIQLCASLSADKYLPCYILRQSFISLRYFGEKLAKLNEEYMTGLFSRQEARDY